MSDQAISMIVTAVCGLISTIVLAWMQKSTKISVDQSNVKLDDAVGKREKIHDLVNSNFSQVSADVKSANDRLVTMQGIVSQLVEKMTKANGGHDVRMINPAPTPTGTPPVSPSP
jgi:hypothetical protein